MLAIAVVHLLIFRGLVVAARVCWRVRARILCFDEAQETIHVAEASSRRDTIRSLSSSPTCISGEFQPLRLTLQSREQSRVACLGTHACWECAVDVEAPTADRPRCLCIHEDTQYSCLRLSHVYSFHGRGNERRDKTFPLSTVIISLFDLPGAYHVCK